MNGPHPADEKPMAVAVCPLCGHNEADPKFGTDKDGYTTIEYRCRKCGWWYV